MSCGEDYFGDGRKIGTFRVDVSEKSRINLFNCSI